MTSRANIFTHRQIIGQNPQTGVIFRDSQFTSRAKHPHGDFTAHLGLFNREVTRQNSADLGARHQDAFTHIGRTAHNLQGFTAIANINLANMQVIGIFMIFNGEHSGHHNA